MEPRRLAVVSNRLPVVLTRENGSWSISPGSGGLVTALGPVLRDRGGLWIGWMGNTVEALHHSPLPADLLNRGAAETGYTLKPVSLTDEDLKKFYYGFSNEILWPLFHDLPTRCNFDPGYWKTYREVNGKYAQAVVEHTDEEDYVWIHDYQLIMVGRALKQLGVSRHTGFFLHIPFPPLDVFLKLPWRFEILDGLMEYDLVGFQTARDRRNFLGCVKALKPGTRITGRGSVSRLVTPDRELLVGAFPISIDFMEFSHMASSAAVSWQAQMIRHKLPNRQLILGVDRLDYTKGIPNKLLALRNALERYPELRRRITLIQVLVPSRKTIKEYALLKQEIERLVGEINGEYTEVGWTPITYIFRSLDRSQLAAYYRACDMALVTPLKDGMNLVAKEYCASSTTEDGVLILSEFAGAAVQLHHGALMVNPYDVEGVANAIHEGYRMDLRERKIRMKALRRSIRKHDVFGWVNSFLRAGIAKDLRSFPHLEFFVPAPQEAS
ncbi:MAG: trehalose-6-phosphate synthase [Syntrophobacteraceae bacterium]|jgi:trehalose 6-phosphate synthase|nr:trehalose-6-phosphate synthase [Syntrophobacteraceae bacterium]